MSEPTKVKESAGAIWLVMQPTRHGERYFLGGYPQHLDSWTADIRKAARFSWEQVVEVTEHCAAYTCGERPQRIRA